MGHIAYMINIKAWEMLSIFPHFGYQQLNQREKKTYAMEKILTKSKFAFCVCKSNIFQKLFIFQLKTGDNPKTYN